MRQSKFIIRFGIVTVCLSILYFTTFWNLVLEWWQDPDFSHGFLIPVIAAYLAWERRKDLTEILPEPRNIGALFVFLGLLLFALGNLAAENFTMRFSFLIVICGLVVFHLGWKFMKKLLFPIAFLMLMIPVPSILLQKLTFPMQLVASRVATLSLQTLDVPVLREGNVIHLSHTSLEVVEACSGIRSLISLLALGVVFAYFTKRKLWQRMVLVLACFPITIVVNSTRVTATGILANRYGPSVAEGFFHGFSGYVLFIVAFVLLLTLGFFLSKLERVFD